MFEILSGQVWDLNVPQPCPADASRWCCMKAGGCGVTNHEVHLPEYVLSQIMKCFSGCASRAFLWECSQCETTDARMSNYDGSCGCIVFRYDVMCGSMHGFML